LTIATPPASLATRSWSFPCRSRSWLVDLGADALHARLDRLRFTRAVDDGGVFLGDFDALRLAEVLQSRLLERQAHLFGDDLPAGEDGDVLEHGLAASPNPGAFTAQVLRMPRRLLTTSVASASLSTSSAMISNGRPALATCSRSAAGRGHWKSSCR